MPRLHGQFSAIAGLAIKELLRQPICLLLTLSASVLTILLPQAVAHQMGQQAGLARDSALAFQLVFGIMLAGYAAGSTLHSECVSGRVLTIFSRPVERATFLLAKLAAIAILIALFVWTSTTSALMAESLVPRYFETNTIGITIAILAVIASLGTGAFLNLCRNHSFAASAYLSLPVLLSLATLLVGSLDPEGSPVVFASRLNMKMIPAGAMAGMALLMFATLALTLATRMKPAPTVALLAIIFAAGLISDYLVTLCANVPVVQLPLRAMLPDIQAFWVADELTAAATIPASTLWHGLAYAVSYSTGVTGLGILLFRNRDF